MPIISLRREDADRLGYNNAVAWRNLIRSKQFETAEAYNIPAKDLVWYGAFHNKGHHPHIHIIVYNKNPDSEYLSRKSCNDIRVMLTKTIFKDELKQLYDKRQTLRDKIIDEVKEKVDVVVKIICKDNNLQELYSQWCQVQLTLLRYYHKNSQECFEVIEKNKDFERRLQNAILKAGLKDNRQGNVYTNKVEASPVCDSIVFSLCKMLEQSIDSDERTVR